MIATRALARAVRPAAQHRFTTLPVAYEFQCATELTTPSLPPSPRAIANSARGAGFKMDIKLPEWVVTELRTSHAGEAGATWIYKGASLAAQLRGHSAEFKAFVNKHHDTEAGHFKQFDSLLEPAQRSSLLPLWRGAGFAVGFASALVSEEQMYLTTRHVESFVVEHLQHQIHTIEHRPRTRERFASLRAMLEQIRDDEAHHKDEGSRLAVVASDDDLSPAQRAWAVVVKAGSAGAVSVARWV